ncbi:MAG: hypothetical protein U0X76_06940 [Bacteroidia bacterium]
MRKFLSGLLLLTGLLPAVTAQSFYDLNTIQTIEINFDQPDWDYQMDTTKIGASITFIVAAYISINGVQLDSVGVKYKGNSSYDSTYIKNPLHVHSTNFKISLTRVITISNSETDTVTLP